MIRFLKINYERLLIISCLLLCLISMYSIAAGQYLLIYITFIVSFATLLIGYVVLNRAQLLKITFFFAPMSIGVGLPGDAEIQVPTEPMIGILTLLLFLYVVSLRHELKILLRHPISILLLAEVVWMIACTVTSELKSVSIKYILIRFCYICTFYFLSAIFFRKEKKPWLLYLLYALGMLLPILNAMLNHGRLGFRQQTSYVMPQPFFSDHTVYGACIAFLIPVILVLIFSGKKFIQGAFARFTLVLLLAVLITAGFLSYSRAAWLSLVAALGLYILIRMRYNGYAFLLTLIMLTGFYFVFEENIQRYLEQNNAISNKENIESQIKSISNINSDVSNKERLNRWKCAIRMGNERPVFGFGPRTYKFFYGNYQQRKDMTYTSTFNGTKGHAHSEYLQYWAETGVLGFALHALIFVVVMFKGIQLVRYVKDSSRRLLATMATLGFTTYFVHGFFNGFLDDDKMASLVFMSMALITVIDIYRHQEVRATESPNE